MCIESKQSRLCSVFPLSFFLIEQRNFLLIFLSVKQRKGGGKKTSPNKRSNSKAPKVQTAELGQQD